MNAEDDDGSCEVNDECGVCGGNGIADGDCDCDGNQLDECGECDGDNSTCGGGCTDPSACNYDPSVEDDDGSCQYEDCTWGDGLCTGLSYEVVSSDPLGTGATTYRLYANFTADAAEVTAMYGTDSTPWEMIATHPDGFYNDIVGSDFGGGVNPLILSLLSLDLEFDSWFTIGAQPGDDDGLNSAFDAALNFNGMTFNSVVETS